MLDHIGDRFDICAFHLFVNIRADSTLSSDTHMKNSTEHELFEYAVQ